MIAAGFLFMAGVVLFFVVMANLGLFVRLLAWGAVAAVAIVLLLIAYIAVRS